MSTQTPQTHQLTLTRIVNVPVHKVWAARTVPEQVCVWFCPKPWYVRKLAPKTQRTYIRVVS